jgi:prepilin-type N-terminal cleavage/methylation domain-containing protein
MIARIRKSIEEKDQGFTLIELLVVIIIIGILAAIAIPVFLNQRKKAVDASMKSDARQVANEMETAFTDTQVYDGPTALAATKLSTGNLAAVAVDPGGAAYCVTITRAAGAQPGSFAAINYDSDNGGLVANGGACT